MCDSVLYFSLPSSFKDFKQKKQKKNRCVADPQVEQPDSFSPAEISLVSISILSFFFFGLGYSGIS